MPCSDPARREQNVNEMEAYFGSHLKVNRVLYRSGSSVECTIVALSRETTASIQHVTQLNAIRRADACTDATMAFRERKKKEADSLALRRITPRSRSTCSSCSEVKPL